MNTLKSTRLAAAFLAMSGLAATAAFVQAQQGNASDSALRELGIMRNIFGAALQSEGRKGNNRFGMNMGAPEALYLAGQGMVFTFHLNGGGGGGIYVINGNQFTIPAVPAPPVVSINGGDYDFDYDFDFDFDFDFDYGNGDPRNAAARAQQEEYRDQLRALNEDIRAKQQDLRDMQREIRDLQRAQRDPDVNNEAKIREQQAAMEKAMQEMTEQGTRMQQLQQEYQAEQLAAFEAVRTEQTALIFSTLCDYGNTLRSLSNGEHVNIVLRNYTDGQTQVHVFDYADFANCSSADALRQAGRVYVQDSRGF